MPHTLYYLYYLSIDKHLAAPVWGILAAGFAVVKGAAAVKISGNEPENSSGPVRHGAAGVLCGRCCRGCHHPTGRNGGALWLAVRSCWASGGRFAVVIGAAAWKSWTVILPVKESLASGFRNRTYPKSRRGKDSRWTPGRNLDGTPAGWNLRTKPAEKPKRYRCARSEEHTSELQSPMYI